MTPLEQVTMLAQLRIARERRTERALLWAAAGFFVVILLQAWGMVRPASTDHTAEPQYECTPICGNHK